MRLERLALCLLLVACAGGKHAAQSPAGGAAPMTAPASNEPADSAAPAPVEAEQAAPAMAPGGGGAAAPAMSAPAPAPEAKPAPRTRAPMKKSAPAKGDADPCAGGE